MTPKEIKQKMSIPDWTILDGHEGGKDIIDDKGVFLFEVNSEEYSSDTDRSNLFAIVTAVNGTYGVGIDPCKVEEMWEVLNMIRLSIDGGGRTVTFNDLQIEHMNSLLNSAKL